MKNILVTGGAGFIGSHIADAYISRGDRVWVVDDFSTGKPENLNPRAELLEADITDPVVRDLFQEVSFDVVSHHAAQVDVRVSVDDPAHDARINTLGLLNLIEGAHETGVSRFVYVSSGGVVYGEPEQLPIPETAAKCPLSPYGVSKLSGEHYLHYYHHIKGIDYVALRYSNVYGPRQHPHGEAGVVAIFINRLLQNEPITVFGDGEQSRDYVFVNDVVAANLLLSETELDTDPGSIDDRAFNVGTGIGTSVNRLADLLQGIADRESKRKHHDERPGELRHNRLDSKRLQQKGWVPATSLSDGLQQTYEFIEKARQGCT